MIEEVKAGHLTELPEPNSISGTQGSLTSQRHRLNKSTDDLQRAVQESQTTLAGLAAEQERIKKFVETWAQTLDTLRAENGSIKKDLQMAQRVCSCVFLSASYSHTHK